MAELQVLEVAGIGKFEVPESFMTSLKQIQAKLMVPAPEGPGMEEGPALKLAFESTQVVFGNAKVAKADKPQEVVPDLAELARPIVERALAKNKGTMACIQAYLTAQEKFQESLAESGLDTDLEIGGGSAAAYIWLEKAWEESEDVLAIRVKVKRESALAQSAMAVTTAYRGATSAINAIVTKVAEKEGLKTDGIPNMVAVNPDGSVSLTTPRRKSTKREPGNGGGTRSDYTYAFTDGKHVISKDNAVWVESEATDEAGLLAAIKAEWLKDHSSFAKAHWRGSATNSGKPWWPFPANS